MTGSSYRIEHHYHQRRQTHYWLAVPSEKLPHHIFHSLRESCIAAGGWYSRKFKDTPAGFAFPTEQRAKRWADENL